MIQSPCLAAGFVTPCRSAEQADPAEHGREQAPISLHDV